MAYRTDFQDDENGVGTALALARRLGRDVPTLILTGGFGRKAGEVAKPHGLRVLSKPIEPELPRQLVGAMVARAA